MKIAMQQGFLKVKFIISRAVVLASLSSLLALAACDFSRSHDDAKNARNVDEPLPRSSPSFSLGEGWSHDIDTNGGLATLNIARMSEKERNLVQNDVTKNEVVWVNSKSGFTLYKIQGSEKFAKNAFILPKVMVIGSVDGGRAAVRDIPGGRAALTIPVALVDGSQRELLYSTARIRVPDSLYLDESKQKALQEELTESLGSPQVISNLGSCPKSITIRIAGSDHDVTPSVFTGPHGPTGCQPNQPFTVTLTGSKKLIERLLSEDVFNGAVEIAATYDVAATFVDEIRLYQIQTAPFYDRLKAKLIIASEKGHEKKEVSEDEANQILSGFAREALSKWATSEPFFEKLKAQAISQMRLIYFNERPNDKARLLILKDDSDFKPYDVLLRQVNERFGRQGETFYSSSIIKPILNSTNIAIRGEERQDLWKAPKIGIAQDVFTVHDGDEYELQLTSVGVHEYEFGDDKKRPEIQDKGLVCLDKPGETMPACKRYKNECIENKFFCKKPKIGCKKYGTKLDCSTQYNFSVIGCMSIGIFGGCNIERKCQPLEDRDICTEYGEQGCEDYEGYCAQTHQICELSSEEPLCRNQITDLRITKYFTAPAPVNYREINAPIGNTDQDPISGLGLRFKWPDGALIDCPLFSLMTDLRGQSVRFKVKNTDYCKPFPDKYKGTPLLSIVNKISAQRRNIPCGIMNYSTVEGTKYYGCNNYRMPTPTPDMYHSGNPFPMVPASTAPLYVTYYPVVDLNATLISRTNAFTSGESLEGVAK